MLKVASVPDDLVPIRGSVLEDLNEVVIGDIGWVGYLGNSRAASAAMMAYSSTSLFLINGFPWLVFSMIFMFHVHVALINQSRICFLALGFIFQLVSTLR